ncbi:hypothetical protein VB773_22445 [Haloarculaceae archaeon H-GB2-1]|nr:hypothetical protein [Haloarculaceae archaeon H-GB11]MEA5410060.1 hypothetical protein [Haloarculaceae archaeon H-GB2-1]
MADFADELVVHVNEVERKLDGAQFGTFDVISAILDFNYSYNIYEARRLRSAAGDDLSSESADRLDSLLTELQLFGPAREHFKTLYFQWELIGLSRAMLYTAMPALTTAVAMILFFDTAGSLPGVTLGVGNILWLVLGAAMLSITPFVLLVSYILRIATIARRTLAMGPFILRETGRETGDGSE